ncbi:MAG: ankyrin repeat domain-containing protein [Gammaproteobacteria bacterium]|nr:ankyrin repeat domain-containing protein [Gammaproteobacteria bacterium]
MSSESFLKSSLDSPLQSDSEESTKANTYDKSGNTPLISAILAEDYTEATRLINHGAKVDACNSYGNTALMFACYGDNLALVILLLKNDAQTNFVNKNGETALFNACSNMSGESNIEIVKHLLASGAQKTINTKEHIYNESPLSIACEYQDEKLATLLIDNGADLRQVGKNKTHTSWLKTKVSLSPIQLSELNVRTSIFFPKVIKRRHSESDIKSLRKNHDHSSTL